MQRVLEIPGIDVSIHAGTKYLAGHSDLTAGTVTCADGVFVDRLARGYRLLGGALDAFSAFLLHRGAKTLDARMERHGRNAMRVAKALEAHPAVAKVYYPARQDSAEHFSRLKMQLCTAMDSIPIPANCSANP